VWICEWDKVRIESEEAMALAEETGEAFSVAVARTNLAAVAAIRGELDQGEALARAAGNDPLAIGMRSILVATTQVHGLVALLRGNGEEAYRTLLRAFDSADPTYHRYMRWWTAPELADAAVAAGRTEHAETVLAELHDLAERVPAPMITVASFYTRAVLARDDHADLAYEAAIASTLRDWPFYRARLELHQGRRLRRLRRLPEARETLRAARDTFDALGAAPFAETVRVELRAAGENSLRRTAHMREQLSAQELQIATMAAAGLTNRQIAERLFLSHRTVGSHLYRIYPRLGITSRTELAAALETTTRSI
jgi:ATP/maltotriose-dependent transcriptional regulator MalT